MRALVVSVDAERVGVADSRALANFNSADDLNALLQTSR
jgi:molybdopterin-guanine dinucleotide biosynthesis protein A